MGNVALLLRWWLLVCLQGLIAGSVTTSLAPPIHSVYHHSIRIPFIGPQQFRLRILNGQQARLEIEGRLKIDEVLDYHVKPCGALSFVMTERLERVLSRFRTSLIEVGYDNILDIPYVVVSPPIPTKIRIPLSRQADDSASLA